MKDFGDFFQNINDARHGFETKIVRRSPKGKPAEQPPGRVFQLVKYDSEVGPLAAYVTKPSRRQGRYPAIIWIAGGDNNSIGDVWSPMPREFDQTARAFRDVGMVMMFPSQRGGNDNPGQREGFFGEVNDILAAADYLAKLPYVDPDRIYLGGHSTGATLALLVAESSDRFRATFAVGPVSMATHYGPEHRPYDTANVDELQLRAPMNFTSGLTSPVYIVAGEQESCWSSLELMYMPLALTSKSHLVDFIKVPGENHFSVLYPATRVFAREVARTRGDFELSEAGRHTLTGKSQR